MMKYLFPLILVCLTIGNASLQAQNKDAERLKLSFCATSISNSLRTIYLPVSKPKGDRPPEWLETRLNIHTASNPVEYKGSRSLIFYDSKKDDAKAVARVVLRGDASSYILVFLPNPKTKGYRVLAIPDRDFKYGSYYFRNFSSHRVAITLGKKRKVIEKNAALNVKAADQGAPELVLIQAQFDQQVKPIKQSKWQLQPNQRELVVFYNAKSGKNLSMKHIVSIRPADPKNQR